MKISGVPLSRLLPSISWLIAALLFIVGTAHATEGGTLERVLEDGRVVIAYPGGRYTGEIGEAPSGLDPHRLNVRWSGRCVFEFRSGARFEGICEDDRFARGFLRGADGDVQFLDRARDDEDARTARRRFGL